MSVLKYYDKEKKKWEPVNSSDRVIGNEGTVDHSKLTPESRSLPDQHPINAITGLEDALLQVTDDSVLEFLLSQGVVTPYINSFGQIYVLLGNKICC